MKIPTPYLLIMPKGQSKLVGKFVTNSSGALLLLNLFQVTESISGSVVPLAMFLHEFCNPTKTIRSAVSFSNPEICDSNKILQKILCLHQRDENITTVFSAED